MIARIALAVYRTVRTHVVVLVEAAKRWRLERQEFDNGPLGEPAKRLGWEDDQDTLGGFEPVRVPETSTVDVPETGRHSKGSAA